MEKPIGKNKDLIILRTGGDIDCLCSRDKKNFFINNFKLCGLVETEQRFFHIGLKKIWPKKEEIDLQFSGLSQSNLIFLKDKYFFDNRYSKKMILNLALLLHLIVNKGNITRKRKNEFYRGFKKLSKGDRETFFLICKNEYGREITAGIKNITKKRKVDIVKLKWKIIFNISKKERNILYRFWELMGVGKPQVLKIYVSTSRTMTLNIELAI